jgi:hypothetical protein
MRREEAMTHYNETIREACGVDSEEASVIERVLRADPSTSTLDHLSRGDLARAARDAQEVLEILRAEDPEVARFYEREAVWTWR